LFASLCTSIRNKGSFKFSVSCRKQTTEIFLTETKIKGRGSFLSRALGGSENREVEKHVFLSRLEWVWSACFLGFSAVSNRLVSRLAFSSPWLWPERIFERDDCLGFDPGRTAGGSIDHPLQMLAMTLHISKLLPRI
jgi:hypothetical protein